MKSAHASLKEEYSYTAWLHLSEMILLHLIVFNRRRRGERQFLKMRDFENPTSLAETDKLYRELTSENKKKS